MTQHLGAPPRPWAGLESHLHTVPRPQAPPAVPELTAVALVLGYLARKRLHPVAG